MFEDLALPAAATTTTSPPTTTSTTTTTTKSDRAISHVQREDIEWKYQKKSVDGGVVVSFKEFSRV